MLAVIGGFARSGTSMLRNVLNEHDAIYCINEVPIKRTYPAMVRSFGTYEQRARELGSGYPFFEKAERMIAEQWMGLSKTAEDRDLFEAASIHANKTPGSESYFLDYEKIIPPQSIRYIYCWRDPVKVLESNFSMAWSGQNFEYTFGKMKKSYETYLSLRPILKERLLVFDLDAFINNPLDVSSALCYFIGVDQSFVLRMANLPPANTREQRKRNPVKRELSEQEKARIVNDPLVQSTTDIIKNQMMRD